MNIGDAGKVTGLPAKTIRYYEDIGLIRPLRQENGYRDYGESELHRLAFLRRARSLGFSIEDCRKLLSLYDDRGRASADVKDLAESHIREIEAKIEELKGLRKVLKSLAEACHGDHRPDCPILDDLACGGGAD
ncbi:Cu(I)-responsive transcriptional regulator [Stappia sp. F7233]|uniref:Cu(I)-responsive transcriptional regulator n=1 Tax=Stappia albiluteola TaxID=2758565 RepID=A0A839ADM3_9HYPH|nr:Cu(I)-responsive transcriptional regulator [Stappia albiluteola]MBA5777641.1 Cu(I)-responsive transcriptional regulator [Stappia albiluteola]